MYLTGFADEAAKGIDGQIKATKELGWENIEARNIDGTNLHDISDAEFDVVYGKLQDAGVKINCFGSAIANWAKKIEDPFDITVREIKRAVPRMKKLGTKYIRVMSYAPFKDRGPEDQMEEERFKRLREIHKMFDGEGLMALHENCDNYGGLGWIYTMRIIENVPGLKLVFDTGNPVSSRDYSKSEPYPYQSSLEFYSKVKDHVEYIHIKDERVNAETGELTYTWPGEGDGDVTEVVADALSSGYDGGISIEPHVASVFHAQTGGEKEDVMFSSYVEYGRRVQAIIKKIEGK